MERAEIQKRLHGIVRRVANSTVTSMHVAMLSRDKPGLLDNVKCLMEEDPETAKELLQSAIEVLAASLLLEGGTDATEDRTQ